MGALIEVSRVQLKSAYPLTRAKLLDLVPRLIHLIDRGRNGYGSTYAGAQYGRLRLADLSPEVITSAIEDIAGICGLAQRLIELAATFQKSGQRQECLAKLIRHLEAGERGYGAATGPKRLATKIQTEVGAEKVEIHERPIAGELHARV